MKHKKQIYWNVTLLDMFIIGCATFLSIHFNNGNWMWFSVLIIATGSLYEKNES